jgi:hypothetical protein
MMEAFGQKIKKGYLQKTGGCTEYENNDTSI